MGKETRNVVARWIIGWIGSVFTGKGKVWRSFLGRFWTFFGSVKVVNEKLEVLGNWSTLRTWEALERDIGGGGLHWKCCC